MPRPDEPPMLPEEEPAGPSKTRRKHAMHALQDLGESLVALDPKRLPELDLPERLVDAVLAARGIRAHEGRRRQIQYIGKLMRDIDPEPVLAKLAERKQKHDLEIRHFQEIERWRDRLLSEPAAAMAELLQEHPRADRATLAKLLEKAEKERLEQRSPVGARELFAFLRQLLA